MHRALLVSCCSLAGLIAVCPLALARASEPTPAVESGCNRCHADPKVQSKLVDKRRPLDIDVKSLRRSVHRDLFDCTDCHTQLAGADPTQEHDAKLGPPTCTKCHAKQVRAYGSSVHGEGLARGKTEVARCADCHGAHDMVRVKNPNARTAKLRSIVVCGNCHRKRSNHGNPHAVKNYLASKHGRALLKAGLMAAPACIDCHGTHDIYRREDHRSHVHHRQVPKTCGKCHTNVVKVHAKSVHGRERDDGKERAVCTDCHTAHEIVAPSSNAFKLQNDIRCGRCHEDRLHRYQETYHGKAHALGRAQVASCSDCHGAHDILPSKDPRSHLASGSRRLQTCRSCHRGAPPAFTGYMAHADHTDRENYPMLFWAFVAMTSLLLGVFAFFGLHTILWVSRSLITLARDPAAFLTTRRKIRRGKLVYTRFRPVDRFCHFLVIVSFILLVITGMPLKFFDSAWARWLIDLMGGAYAAAALHRLGALITFSYFGIHLISLASPLWRNRRSYRDESGRFRLRLLLGYVFGPDSPMPNRQDLRDFWAHVRYFLGRGPMPKLDRWTYWEKFDYLAVFWGVAVIGLSGLIMWFPEAFSHVLPGWTINLALVVHSDEALLAAGFIFIFHFFNVHIRPEKFPIDLVIFSGSISEEEMQHERGRLHERLQAEGRLADEKVRDEWGRWKAIVVPFGMTAFIIGTVLVFSIIWMMAGRLLE